MVGACGLINLSFSPYRQKKYGLDTRKTIEHSRKWEDEEGAHAGHPIAIATAARMESPTPYPSALYMLGAKSGNPNPQKDRTHVIAARADAA